MPGNNNNIGHLYSALLCPRGRGPEGAVQVKQGKTTTVTVHGKKQYMVKNKTFLAYIPAGHICPVNVVEVCSFTTTQPKRIFMKALSTACVSTMYRKFIKQLPQGYVLCCKFVYRYRDL